MKFKNITVAGGGVLGSQIAFQSAYCGFDVKIWARNENSAKRIQEKLDNLKKTYIDAINKMSKDKAEWCAGIADEKKFNKQECLKKVKDIKIDIETDLSAAVKDADLVIKETSKKIQIETEFESAFKGADLVIEAIAELKQEKIDFYKKLAKVLDEKTVLVTNSSTMLPSTFANYTGRPNKYLALHFANNIWKKNTAEVMMHDGTEKKYFDAVVKFANDIRMVALPITKEKSGYLLNSMLVPFLLSGFDLYVNGVSNPESIDKAWTQGTGAPNGPFSIMDVVGLQTTYNIVEQYQKVPGLFSPMLKKMMMPYNFKGMKEILEKKIKAGKLGKQSGEGFYKY